MTLHMVEQAISIEHVKRPKEATRIPLRPESQTPIILEAHVPTKRKVTNVAEYYAALRLLTEVYTYCGTHAMDSAVKLGQKVTYFPWGQALGHPDLQTVINVQIPEQAKVSWL